MNLPPSMPLPMLVQSALWIRRPVEVLEYCRKHYGPAFVLKLPPFNVVLLTEPEAMRTVFASKGDDMHAGEVNRILRALVSDITREKQRPWKWLLRQRDRTDARLYQQIAARRAEGHKPEGGTRVAQGRPT